MTNNFYVFYAFYMFSSNYGTHAITGTPNIVDWHATLIKN